MNLFIYFSIFSYASCAIYDEDSIPKINIAILDQSKTLHILHENVKKADVVLNNISIKANVNNLGSAYQLECFSAFPIQLSYEGEGTPQVNPTSYRQLREIEDFNQRERYIFEVRLKIIVREGNSGKYICKGILEEHKYLDNHVYLFIPGPYIFIGDKAENGPLGVLTLGRDQNEQLVNELHFDDGKIEHIFLEIHNGLTLIPCAISSPEKTIQVKLLEEIEILDVNRDESRKTMVDVTNKVTFFPKQGFIPRSRNFSLTTSPRLFVCEAFNSRDNRNSSISYFVEKLSNKTTTEIEYTELESLEVADVLFTCSVTPTNQVVFFNRKDCFTQMECYFLEEQYRKKYLPRVMSSDLGTFTLAYKTATVNIFDSFEIFDNPVIEAQVSGSVLPISGIFICSCGRNRVQSLIYNSFQQSILTNFSEKPRSSEILQVFRIQDNENESEKKVTLRCIGRAFFYSYGFLWTVEMNDGQNIVYRGEEMKPTSSGFIQSNLILPNSENKTFLGNIKQIICHAPIWNSFEWDNQTIKEEKLFQTNQASKLSIYHQIILNFFTINIIYFLY